MDVAAGFPGALQFVLSYYPASSTEEYLELRQRVRCGLWGAAIRDPDINGKFPPTQEERTREQMALRQQFLGENPQKQWVIELQKLVHQEVKLDSWYRALQWHAEETYLRTKSEHFPVGYGFYGPGLLWKHFVNIFQFGDGKDCSQEALLEGREDLLGLSGVPELRSDLEFLVRKEEQLRKEYLELLRPIFWGVPEATEETAMEQKTAGLCPGFVAAQAEDLVTGQSPADTLSAQAPEMEDLINFEDVLILEPPTEVLATVQDGLCPIYVSMDCYSGPAEELATSHSAADPCSARVDAQAMELTSFQCSSNLCYQSSEDGMLAEDQAEELARIQSSSGLCHQPSQNEELVEDHEEEDSMEIFDTNIPVGIPDLGDCVLCPKPSENGAVRESSLCLQEYQEFDVPGTPAVPPEQINNLSVDETPAITDPDATQELAPEQNPKDNFPELSTALECQEEELSDFISQEKEEHQGQCAAGITLQCLSDVVAQGTKISTCVPLDYWSVGPNSQTHFGRCPDPVSPSQQLQGLQGQEKLGSSPNGQTFSLGPASTDVVGFKFDAVTNYGVNPYGVSSYVSSSWKGEKCDMTTMGLRAPGRQAMPEPQNPSFNRGPAMSYVKATLC